MQPSSNAPRSSRLPIESEVTTARATDGTSNAQPTAQTVIGTRGRWHIAGCGQEVVRVLLDAHADPNAFNDRGEAPLQMAVAHNGNVSHVQLLVDSGAKMDIANSDVELVGARHPAGQGDHLKLHVV